MPFDLQKSMHALLVAQFLVWTGAAKSEDYFDRYGMERDSPAVDVGVQPLGFPSGVISAVMQRDRLLKSELQAAGHPLRTYPFRRGADMIGPLSDHRLDVGLLGDMPTLMLASAGKIWIVGLVKQSATAIVARGEGQVRNLAGKKIGYVPLSSAHHTLLQGLASAGLSESQVSLVPLGVDDMPGALARGEIDAFAAWEPAPTQALQESERNNIVFRGRTTDYLVVERDFAKRSPAMATAVAAALVRAVGWMRRSQANVDKAARWALADNAAFSGKVSPVSPDRVAAITRREILNVPSAPFILPPSKGETPLKSEFDFLLALGKLPNNATLAHVAASFEFDALKIVMTDPGRYRTTQFDFDD